MKRLLYRLIVLAVVVATLLVATVSPAAPAQAQTTEILKPTAYTDNSGKWSNEANAYDDTVGGEDTTYAVRQAPAQQVDDIVYHTWASAGQSHTGRRLYIRRAASGFVNDTWDLKYSVNGGTSWIDIEVGNQNITKGNTTAVSIDTALDLSLLQLAVDVNQIAGVDSITIELWDIWLEADIAPTIPNTPNTWDFGTVSKSSSTKTGLTYIEGVSGFKVTNNSSYAINIAIIATDMTGGATWTLSDTATPAADIYGLRAGLQGDSEELDYPVIVKKTSATLFISNLAPGASQEWGLQLLAPTEFSDGGAKSGTVTLIATPAA